MEEHHDVTQDGSQDGSQGDSQGGIQDVLQDGELDDWIEKQIKKNPKITAKELALLSQKGLSTISDASLNFLIYNTLEVDIVDIGKSRNREYKEMQPLDYIKERLHFSYGIQDGTQGGIQGIPYPTSTTTSLPLTIAFFTRSKSWRKSSWLLRTKPGAWVSPMRMPPWRRRNGPLPG